MSSRPRTAFVLSGGASLGALQVGMLRALYERGITADLLVGTSVGALNAAFVASRSQTPATARALARVWRGVERGDAFPLSLRAVAGGLAGRRDQPISQAVELGAERIYVLSTREPSCPQVNPPRTALDAAICGISLLMGSRLESDVGRYGREAELIVLPAPNAIQVQPTDFDHSSELTATAYSAARDALAGADTFRETPLAAGSAQRLAAVG